MSSLVRTDVDSQPNQTYLEALRAALHDALLTDSRVILLGEDIEDPYGGAFKVTRGLSMEFPDRVTNTPISEAGIVGAGIGLAMRGFLPVVEIMFGDFITLCMDQIVNSGTKLPLMYRDKVSVPIVVRTPMGGGRGYGPTHSQSLEKFFLGVPGLKVVAPSIVHAPGELLKHAILTEKSPVLFIEHKLLYPVRYGSKRDGLRTFHVGNENAYPTAVVENFPPDDSPDVTVITYGGTSLLLLELMEELIAEEIKVRSILPSALNESLDREAVELAGASPATIIAEEGTAGFNWGSEVAASLYDSLFDRLKQPLRRLSSKRDVIPAAGHLESEMLLNKKQLTDAIVAALL